MDNNSKPETPSDTPTNLTAKLQPPTNNNPNFSTPTKSDEKKPQRTPLTQSPSAYKKEIDHLRASLQDRSNTLDQNTGLIDSLNNELKKEQEVRKNYQQLVYTFYQKVNSKNPQDLQDLKRDLEDSLTLTNSENETLREENNALKQNKSEDEQKITTLLDALQEEDENKKKLYQEATDLIQDYEKQIEAFNGKQSQLLRQQQEDADEVRQLRRQIADGKADVERQRYDKERDTQIIEKLSNENKDLKDELDHLRNSLGDLENKYHKERGGESSQAGNSSAKDSNEVNQLKKEIENLENDVKKYKDAMKGRTYDPRGREPVDKNDLNSLRQALEEKDLQLKDMKSQYAGDIGQLKQEIENFNSQRESQLQSQKASYEQILKKRDEEIVQLKKGGQGSAGQEDLLKYLPDDKNSNQGSEKKSEQIVDRKPSDASQNSEKL
jgi:chromosome segregation ATPase